MQLRIVVLLITTTFGISAVAGGAAASNDKSYTGAIEIRRSVESDAPLIIAIDSVRGAVRDGFADVAYVFYMDAPSPDFRFQAERAHVEDLGGQQLVIVSQGQHLTFSIAGQTPVKRSTDTLIFANGTGLARYWGEPVSGLRVAAGDASTRVGCDGEDSGACYSDWSLGGGGGGGSCNSGGPGATQCSIEGNVMGSGGSCSVSCGPGYYACCSFTQNCRCIKY